MGPPPDLTELPIYAQPPRKGRETPSAQQLAVRGTKGGNIEWAQKEGRQGTRARRPQTLLPPQQQGPGAACMNEIAEPGSLSGSFC